MLIRLTAVVQDHHTDNAICLESVVILHATGTYVNTTVYKEFKTHGAAV